MDVQVLEPKCEWRAEDVRDPAEWTETLNPAEVAEIEAAIAHARAKSEDFLELGNADFPLPTLSSRLKGIERELMDGRGFVVIRGLPRDRRRTNSMRCAWPIGGSARIWADPGRRITTGTCLEADVTDQGKTFDDPTARGNELGEIGLDFHCDGSDLVGLLCLRTGVSGGASAHRAVPATASLHNALVRAEAHPDPAAGALQPPTLPTFIRGEQRLGARGWYEVAGVRY